MLQIIKQHQKKYPQVHEYKKAEKQWNDIFGVTEKQIRAAVDEIEASISYTMAQKSYVWSWKLLVESTVQSFL